MGNETKTEPHSTWSADQGGDRLMRRNVRIDGRRTSIKLERHMWDALEEICQRTDQTVNEICSEVYNTKSDASFTSRMRVFILCFFRNCRG